ncbi:unnamed protein product [Onchocerca ochengi]|uniref:GLOBIN domain-containing protein n=1 Tax=Onchocerca ochengi TaxID=42157 RepID=A0A182E913_ONCOC|nr:unnamed protein product [Onchocerca ochengi]
MSLLLSRKSEGDSLRRHISSSFDSSYLPTSPTKNSSQDLLTKPQSANTLQKALQKMNAFKCPDTSDDQKKSRSLSSAFDSLSFQNKTSSSQNRKKQITRRPHSSDVIKLSQISSGNNNRKNDRMTPTMHRPLIASTTKSSMLSPNSQSIILFCMENARSDIALRIVQRMAHKRDDFAQFYANLSSEQSAELVTTLKKFLSDIVQNIGNLEKIKQISSKYGVEQAHKRSWGFKADFFALLADALTTECVFLDGAAHQPTETIEAWATLVELMFTNVRDGYYMETRQLRRNWQNFKFISQSNLSSQSDQSFDGDSPHSSPSLSHMFTTI